MKHKISLATGLHCQDPFLKFMLYKDWLYTLPKTSWLFAEGSVYFKHEVDLLAFKLRFEL